MEIELSIVMPCLNEAETIEKCIKKASQFLSAYNISGEIVIGDNGSTDGSQDIAKGLGAKVIHVPVKGYGSASRCAIEASRGKFIITADTDDSHDLVNLEPFLDKLRAGSDLVVGNRFKGGVDKESMPFLHRYIGNPVLTFLGNLFFKTSIGDFHCGLRGISRIAFDKLNLTTSGMEFASEMIVKASLANFRITEVPTKVYPAGRSRKSHLRTFPDGWRHLRFLLLYSPRWLFLFPGLILFFVGIIGYITLMLKSNIWELKNALIFLIMVFLGFQFAVFYALTKIFAISNGLIPKGTNYKKVFRYFNLERGLLLGFGLAALGLVLYVFSLFEGDNVANFKQTLTSVMSLVLGIQIILFSFFFSILGLKDNNDS
ncbi:glycosyltransferase family 2 protein [Tamlana sp. 2201CG12-4]|uniref:glycosyltransferase family 2 protein n=1 Tax=Tamlana sp. 2201CG12-4 TaxID=3112582 RepID=UPI002DBAD115|nr:glycosyltransferase family 2 protein [Tamlana sp. 2201CG12-4]MEC3906887.1 glycosyltransferase family 2 protein [Tamlana sp. 2201CG12-4]